MGGPEVVWGPHTWVELQVPGLSLAPRPLWLLISSLQGILIVTGQAKGLSLKRQTPLNMDFFSFKARLTGGNSGTVMGLKYLEGVRERAETGEAV